MLWVLLLPHKKNPGKRVYRSFIFKNDTPNFKYTSGQILKICNNKALSVNLSGIPDFYWYT